MTSPELALTHSRLDGLSIEAWRPAETPWAGVQGAELDSALPLSLVRQELAWVTAALDLGADIGLSRLREGAVRGRPASLSGRRTSNAWHGHVSIHLIAGHAPLWAARSRPGGRKTSRVRCWTEARGCRLEGGTPRGVDPE